MEWYLWLLIGYAVWVFLALLVAYIKDMKRKKLSHLFAGIFLYIICLVISPFVMLLSIYYFMVDKSKNYETFTIHELSDENKIALKNMGFNEGEYVSYNNFDYKGFRNAKHNISIQYNGRVSVRYNYSLSREQKHLIRQIKELPREVNIDEREKELKVLIEERKERLNDWKKWYQKDIDMYQEELKQIAEKKKKGE